MNGSILLGIVGPLIAVSLSWVAMARTFRRDPGRLTSLMMMAFAAKMVFFAVYVSLAMTVFAVSPVPFVTSFVASFVAFYAVEAVLLQRMMKSS